MSICITLGKYPISLHTMGYRYPINFVKKQLIPKPWGKYPIALKPYLQPCQGDSFNNTCGGPLDVAVYQI